MSRCLFVFGRLSLTKTTQIVYITVVRRSKNAKLGSVAGPVIQANGKLTFEDDLRSGGLLYFTSQ